ncbi:transcriptional regulator [Pasteurellaceae bacterium RH1A]|nr:transcriptional regulator [Pasteurellaceae bacterium RH1A]
MNENYRHQQLLELVNQQKRISTADIIRALAVSPATARRDINKLDEMGLLKKVRNGAEALDANSLLNSKKLEKKQVLQRQINNLDEKSRIAEAAAKLCEDDSSIILTCGSTMLLLSNFLCGRNLQVITNYLPLANNLIEQDHQNVVIMGGQYNKNQAIMLSINSEKTEYAANIMFTSGKGLTAEGLYKNDILIANSEQHMIEKVDKLVVLLDSTKLGKRVGMLFSELAKIDVLITGKEADPEIVQQLRDKGLKVILA